MFEFSIMFLDFPLILNSIDSKTSENCTFGFISCDFSGFFLLQNIEFYFEFYLVILNLETMPEMIDDDLTKT